MSPERFRCAAQRANCRANAIGRDTEPLANAIGNDTCAVSNTISRTLYGTTDGINNDAELLCLLNDYRGLGQNLCRKIHRIYYGFQFYVHPRIPFDISHNRNSSSLINSVRRLRSLPRPCEMYAAPESAV